MSEKYKTVLAVTDLDQITLETARKTFYGYKSRGIILNCVFSDDTWIMTDERSVYHLFFRLDSVLFKKFGIRLSVKEEDMKAYMKSFIVFQMGKLSMVSLQGLLLDLKRVCYSDADGLEEYFESANPRWAGYVADFFSLIPRDGRETELNDFLDDYEDAEEYARTSGKGGQRSLAAFESYFRFDEILKRYWKEAEETEEKLFYFPVWLWWNLSGVLPLRPREVTLTPRNCLEKNGEGYLITVRRTRIKGAGKKKEYTVSGDYKESKYAIPERMGEEIKWYLDETAKYGANALKTLFIADPHYARWDKTLPVNSRYFTYTNLRTCLRYFFEEVVRDRYGYNVLYEHAENSLQNDKDIEYLHLGDTRHIALINLILEGATPVVAMMLAGHENPEITSHYYSNISSLIECKTYRQYRMQIKGRQSYALSRPQPKLHAEKFMFLEDGGRCYSAKAMADDYSDCYNAAGPAGEIGACQNCFYYRSGQRALWDDKSRYENQLAAECKALGEIVKRVRSGKGDREDILTVLLNLRDTEFGYQQYLLEKMENENAKTKVN